MADKEEDTSTRATDWEVVSLTASAYAASPGPTPLQSKSANHHDKDKDVEAEASHPLYMSRHFVFPPSHNNMSTEPKASKQTDSLGQETRGKEDGGDLTYKGLDLSKDDDDDEFSVEEEEEEKGKIDDNNIYKTCLEDERAFGGSHVYESVLQQTHPDVSPELVPTKDDDDKQHHVPPCEPWWKRSAASLISQAKETNTVWSIFIAAAVMGVVVLGQRWQHERWQILQLKWESSIGNEKAGRLMGPLSRLKQAFVGGQRRDSFIRVSSQNDS